MGSEQFHADRRKDMAKLIVAFRNFAKAAKNNKAVLNCVHKSTSKNFGVFHWTLLRALHITEYISIVQSHSFSHRAFTVLVHYINITNQMIWFIEKNPARGLI